MVNLAVMSKAKQTLMQLHLSAECDGVNPGEKRCRARCDLERNWTIRQWTIVPAERSTVPAERSVDQLTTSTAPFDGFGVG